MYYIKIPTVRFTDLVRSDPHTKHTKMNNRLYLVQVKGLSYQFPLPLLLILPLSLHPRAEALRPV